MKRTFNRLLTAALVAASAAAFTGIDGAHAAPPRIPPNAVVRDYIVQPGDSAWSIAEAHYGRGEYYKIIYEYNNFKGSGPFLLTPGQVIRLPTIETGPEAHVGWLHRDVRARAPQSVDWLEAREQMSLWRLYRVATGDASAARIVFEDSSDLKMREKALLVIYGASATTSRTSTNPGREITVEAGTVVAGLAALGEGDAASQAPIAVKTPSGSVGILGLAIQVQVDAAVTAVSAMIGKATVSAKDEVVAIPEQYGTVVEKGKRPEKPRPLPAPPAWVDGTPLEVISIVNPGSATSRGRLAAAWTPVAEAGAYRVEVAADAGFKTLTYDAIVDASVTGLRLEALEVGTWWVRVAARTSRGLEGRASAPIRVAVTQLESPQPTSADADGTIRAIGFVRLGLPDDAREKLQLKIIAGPQVDEPQPGAAIYLYRAGRHTLETRTTSGQSATTFDVEIVPPTLEASPWPAVWPIDASAPRTIAFRLKGPSGERVALPGLGAMTSDGETLPIALNEQTGEAVLELPARETSEVTGVRIVWAGGVLDEATLAASAPTSVRAPLGGDLAPLPGTWRRGGHTPIRRAVGPDSLQLHASAVARRDAATVGELTIAGEVVALRDRLALEATFIGQEVIVDGSETDALPSATVGDLWLGARVATKLAPSLQLIPSARVLLGLGKGVFARQFGLEVGAFIRWSPAPVFALELGQLVLGSATFTDDGHEVRSTTAFVATWKPLADLELNASWQLASPLSAGGDRRARAGDVWHTGGVGLGVAATDWLRVGATFGLGVGAATRRELGAWSGRLMLDFVWGSDDP